MRPNLLVVTLKHRARNRCPRPSQPTIVLTVPSHLWSNVITKSSVPIRRQNTITENSSDAGNRQGISHHAEHMGVTCLLWAGESIHTSLDLSCVEKAKANFSQLCSWFSAGGSLNESPRILTLWKISPLNLHHVRTIFSSSVKHEFRWHHVLCVHNQLRFLGNLIDSS